MRNSASVLFSVLLWNLFLLLVVRGQDTTPPTLLNFTVVPSLVDFNIQSNFQVEIYARVEDESGVLRVYIEFLFQGSISMYISPPELQYDTTSGTDGNGVWSTQIDASLANGTPPGVYTLVVHTVDTLSNFMNYTTEDLISLGFSSQIEFIYPPDDTPPEVVGVSVEHDPISVVSGSARQYFIISANDTGHGVAHGELQVLTAVTETQLTIDCYPHLPNVLRGELLMDTKSEPGVYSIESVTVSDRANNSVVLSNSDLRNRGFTYQFTVEANTEPPQLIELIANPDVIDTTEIPVSVTIYLYFASIYLVNVSFDLVSPSKNVRNHFVVLPIPASLGTWYVEAEVVIPASTEGGLWKVVNLTAFDFADQSVAYMNDGDFAAVGFDNNVLFVTSVPDDLPPQLQSIAFYPSTVDVTENTQYVQVQVGITDDVAGAGGGSITISSPTGADIVFENMDPLEETLLTHLLTINPGVEPGEWFVVNVTITDKSGKTSVYSGTDLQQLAPTINVTSVIDNDAPEVIDLSFSPDPIDVNDNDGTLMALLHVGDAGTGISTYRLRLVSPSGVLVIDHYDIGIHINETMISLQYRIPRFTEGGEWKVESLTVSDKRPNERTYTFEELGAAGIQNTFTVISAYWDKDGPEIVSVQFMLAGGTPAVEPITVPNLFHMILHIRDVSGLRHGDFQFVDVVGATYDFSVERSNLQSGDVTDGNYTIIIPINVTFQSYMFLMPHLEDNNNNKAPVVAAGRWKLAGSFPTCIPDAYEPSNLNYPVSLTLPVNGVELNLCDSQLDIDVYTIEITTETAITVWIDHDEIIEPRDFFIHLTLDGNKLGSSSHLHPHTPNRFNNTFVAVSGLTSGPLGVTVKFIGIPHRQISYKMTIVPCAVDEAEITGCLGNIDWTTCRCPSTTTGTTGSGTTGVSAKVTTGQATTGAEASTTAVTAEGSTGAVGATGVVGGTSSETLLSAASGLSYFFSALLISLIAYVALL